MGGPPHLHMRWCRCHVCREFTTFVFLVYGSFTRRTRGMCQVLHAPVGLFCCLLFNDQVHHAFRVSSGWLNLSLHKDD